MKTVLAGAAVLMTLLAASFGTLQYADARYAPMAQFEDLHWSALKEAMRDLEDRIEKAESEELRRELQRDLQDLIDRFCKSYPSDRACKGMVMLGPDGKQIDKATLRHANKAREIVESSIRELTRYTGNRPTIVRVKPKYFLVLTEVGWIDRWPGIEIKAAPK